MKVKIIKANKLSYWYSNQIGSIFEVYDKPEKSYGKLVYVVKIFPLKHWIDVDDTDTPLKERVVFT